MPQDEENYTAIKERQEILVDFVKQVVTIQKNDSLLHLSTLPEDSVLAIASALIQKKRDVEEKKRARQKEAAINRARNISQNTGDNLISTATAGASWYFSKLILQI